MATTTSSPSNGGLGTKKSVFVLITVVGCIAILWPKILYFAMFGGPQANKAFVKDHRSGTGCCDVVLDQQTSSNITAAIAHPGYRKRLNLITGDKSLRQERPPHLRPDGIHPAMRERGRAIPATTTVPIVTEDKPIPSTAPRIVEGRLVMKKPSNNTPYAEPIKSDPEFQDKVFGQDKSVFNKTDPSLTRWKDHDTRWHTNNGNSRNAVDLYAANNVLHRASNESELEFQMREMEQLLEISLLKKKLLETEQAMSRIMGSISKGQGLIDAADEQLNKKTYSTDLSKAPKTAKDDDDAHPKLNKKAKSVENGSAKTNDSKTKDSYNDKSVKVVDKDIASDAEPQSIFLEGSLPHDSQILVADSETKTENVFDDELDDDNKEQPAVVICSKMTLSLINMDPVDKNNGRSANNVDDDDDDEAEIEDEEIEEIEENEEIEDEEVEEEEESEEDVPADRKEEPKITIEKAKLNGKVNKVEETSSEEEELDDEEVEEVEEEEVEESENSGEELQS